MTKELRHWPLIEVVAEFFLTPDIWTDTLPDDLFAKVSEVLPTRKIVRAVTAEFKIGPGTNQQVSQERDRHQFFAEDGTRLIQIDSQVMTVNHLHPYTCWEDYSPLIKQCVDSFFDLRPNADFTGLGLQFINRIELHGLPLDIVDYLVFRPQFDGDFINCGCMVTQPWPEKESVVYRQMQTQPATQDCLPVMLILNARRNRPGATDAVQWMDSAHNKLNEVFKASITDLTKSIFRQPQGV